MTGDPELMLLGEHATEEDRKELKQRLGLDKPLVIQYKIYIADLIRGNLGHSFLSRRPIKELIISRLPNSLKLAFVAVFGALVFGLPLGVLGATKKGRFWDKLARVIAALGQALPTFWVGLVLMMLFGVYLKILPISGMGTWRNYLMPAFCLGFLVMAGIIRLLRSSMLDALDSEYIKLARIKGVPERYVIWKHAFKNSLLSVVSFAGVYFAMLITASIAIETIFAWPGLGRLIYEGIVSRDFPVIQGAVIAAAGLVMLVNLITDLLYAYLDPRIRV